MDTEQLRNLGMKEIDWTWKTFCRWKRCGGGEYNTQTCVKSAEDFDARVFDMGDDSQKEKVFLLGIANMIRILCTVLDRGMFDQTSMFVSNK